MATNYGPEPIVSPIDVEHRGQVYKFHVREASTEDMLARIKLGDDAGKAQRATYQLLCTEDGKPLPEADVNMLLKRPAAFGFKLSGKINTASGIDELNELAKEQRAKNASLTVPSSDSLSA